MESKALLMTVSILVTLVATTPPNADAGRATLPATFLLESDGALEMSTAMAARDVAKTPDFCLANGHKCNPYVADCCSGCHCSATVYGDAPFVCKGTC